MDITVVVWVQDEPGNTQHCSVTVHSIEDMPDQDAMKAMARMAMTVYSTEETEHATHRPRRYVATSFHEPFGGSERANHSRHHAYQQHSRAGG